MESYHHAMFGFYEINFLAFDTAFTHIENILSNRGQICADDLRLQKEELRRSKLVNNFK